MSHNASSRVTGVPMDPSTSGAVYTHNHDVAQRMWSDLGASGGSGQFSTYGRSMIHSTISPSKQSSLADDDSLGPRDHVHSLAGRKYSPPPMNEMLRQQHLPPSSGHITAYEGETLYGSGNYDNVAQGDDGQYGGDVADPYSTTQYMMPYDNWMQPPPPQAQRVVGGPPMRELSAVDLFAHAMEYLPLEDLEVLRTAAPFLHDAVECVAPKPLPCDDVVFIRWTAPAEHATTKGRHRQPSFGWRCLGCGSIATGARRCQHCRGTLSHVACRVFLGQLDKEWAAETAAAIMRSVLPDVTVLHMESHTNGADGRGKGCAWAYVNSVEDALRITSLHKRVFIDLDADNAEGFWYVKDEQLIGHLNAMADTLGQSRGRPVWLPRQPLVAELPANSLLAQYVAMNRRASAQH